MMLVVVVPVAVLIGVGIILNSVIDDRLLQRIISFALASLLYQPLSFGISFYCLQKYRKQPTDAKTVFVGFKRYKSIIVISLLTIIIFNVFSLPYLYVESEYKVPEHKEGEKKFSKEGIINILVLFLILGLDLLASLFLFPIPLLILDKGYNFKKSFTVSWAMLRNRKSMILRMFFAVTLLFFIGMLMCGVGLILSMAIYIVGLAVMYQKLCELHPDIVK